MYHMNFDLKRSLTGMALLTLSAVRAFAGEPIIIQEDRTQIISVSAEPGTVVIGNPSIADVSVNGKQVFLHGHAFGETNLIILDTGGREIANFDITVSHNSNHSLAIYKAGNRFSYTCAPLCEVAMEPGDQGDYIEKVIGVNGSKSGFATGKKSAEAAAPPSPQ
jgi:uncharacterized Zn-binding protein involved in type VI secretion